MQQVQLATHGPGMLVSRCESVLVVPVCKEGVYAQNDLQRQLGSYLVDPASSHMLVSKIKPCMSKYKQSLWRPIAPPEGALPVPDSVEWGGAANKSALALRTWASRLLRHTTSPPTPAMPTTTINASMATPNMDMANDQLLLPPTTLSSSALSDSVAINMSSSPSHSATNSPTLRPAFFSPASRSHCATNIKALNKKRYSGDSNTSHLFAPPTTADNGSGRLPLRSSSSAINLANRANINSTNNMDS
ncbi:predicted protein [Lichtheimia corymbifera JMRC:FSU:9682]|uniref:Uncharacterized protein n=1 Tax=Lichtheimia corymbifera JMRC:FSU:9682 TaxID=1263082 RepID=A0A068SF61_9FUNG|nr:predicted protein [Lichtheimia corymbifera JMRC:FSU:9682]